MDLVELRNPDEARDYLVQGLWLQRVAAPVAEGVRAILEWSLEIAANGQPLPPVGFAADLGHAAFGLDRLAKPQVEIPGWPHALARSYEDHVLGKVYADWTFERAADALRRYEGRDRAKGLAYVVKQVRDRGGIGGVELSPAVLRSLLQANPADVLAQGYESLTRDGPRPLLLRQYEELIRAARRMAEVLGPEDVIALEHRTALADMGQYVAHRQILQLTARFEERLPPRPVRPLVGRKEVPTRVADEDRYPVGGYASIATKGSIESLLHSQLAFMEPESPDLFDMKFVRDELFYYSRDENQFLRRRRTFAFALYPDLVNARFKDPELPSQRIVAVLSAVLALVRRLTDWLSDDALYFELVFVRPAEGKPSLRDLEPLSFEQSPLAHEADLLRTLLREPIERGAVDLRLVDGERALESSVAELARHSQVHLLTLSTLPVGLDPEGAVVTRLIVDGPRPTLYDGNGTIAAVHADDAFDHWVEVVRRVLELWV